MPDLKTRILAALLTLYVEDDGDAHAVAETADCSADDVRDLMRDLNVTTPAPNADPHAVAIKVTDSLRNVAFIRWTKARGWACTLGNGIPASMSYAGIPHGEETETKIALERAKTPADVLRIVKTRVRSSAFKVEAI